jgi:hypothetical protein
VQVETGSGDTDGQLVFRDGFLVAVLVRLSEEHEEDAGKWFLEAGLGRVNDGPAAKFFHAWFASELRSVKLASAQPEVGF